MRKVLTVAFLFLICLAQSRAYQTEYSQLKAEAEERYAAGSYARAHELYSKAAALELPPAEARWVSFRVADTLWRAQAATNTADTSNYERAQRQLGSLVRDIQRVEDRDLVWAEVHESLGDFWWTRRDSKNWGQALTHYQQALDWWAGSPNIDAARDRYLHIVRTAAKPAWAEPYYYYGYYGSLPLEVVENAAKIAITAADKAYTRYLVAMTLRQSGSYEQWRRVPEHFEEAIAQGKETDWYDDALYHYAEWMMNYGRVVETDAGQWRNEADYVKALALFRRLIEEHEKGETRYYDQAKQQIENITKPALSVACPSAFLPDSEIQFQMSWRNLRRIDLNVYRVSLTEDLQLVGKESGIGNWLEYLKLNPERRIKSWSKETQDSADYKPGNEAVRLDFKLPIGAFIIEATGNGVSARDLILVSDASLLLKSSGQKALVYFGSALDGSPIANASVRLWQRLYNGKEWVWRDSVKQTGSDGAALFELAASRSNAELLATAAGNDRTAFAHSYNYQYGRRDVQWRIYAFTDRPAYRPNELVQWKMIARRNDGSTYITPRNEVVELEIRDPKGAKVHEGTATLNSFGSAWGSLELTERMPLGEYSILFWEQGRRKHIGTAVLFRLEEYKLPEFKVAIRTPEENGRKKVFRLGEKVEVGISADYYFGGAVAGAKVEVLVYQNPFHHWWHPRRDYAWYYDDIAASGRWYGGRQGQLLKRETVNTDANGRAIVTFDTPAGVGYDLDYYVEARVTDSSRREVVGSGNVRVTRQRYYAYLHPAHNLYRPKDKVTISVKAIDANDQPVQADGKVTVTRDYWYEIWLDPSGREVKGEELKRVREKARPFPPEGWKLKFRGYQHDEVAVQSLKTGNRGEAEYSFTAEREGYYRITWTGIDRGSSRVSSGATVWVANNATTDLGYRHGGVEIIVDRDTFQAGQTAPVMLNTQAGNRYVLFTIEGEELDSYRVVQMTGTAKLIELPIEEKHVPNIFLSAALISDGQLFVDTKQVVVPPVKHFLNVEVKANRDQYQPQEYGTLDIITRNHAGEPVSAEVGLGLVDDSVYYIQRDYAADPRQFYFGEKRSLRVQTVSTLQHKRLARLIEGPNKELVDRGVISDDRLRQEEGDRPYERLEIVGGIASSRGQAGAYGQHAPNAPVDARKDEIGRSAESSEKSSGALSPGAEPAVQVRTDFRSTVVWQPDVTTNREGKATIRVKYPDSLTSWRATARVATAGSEFGIAATTTRTSKPLIVRLQAPRFFVAGDRVTVSAVINNNSEEAVVVKPSFSATGVSVESEHPEAESLKVDALGQARLDWLVSADRPGPARLKVAVLGGGHSDAMEKDFIVHEHGLEKLVSKSGSFKGRDVAVRLDLPRERRAESTGLTVQVTPSIAVTMLDALPYLIDYPYGCTEQTMSRFLPAAIVTKTLTDLGLRPDQVTGKVFGGIVPETAGETHRKGKKDLRDLDAMVERGLERLYDFQHTDGGWGWWKDGESDHFMTSYVLWGLSLAGNAGVAVRPEVRDRAAAFLEKEIVEEELNHDQQAWMLHALAAHHKAAGHTRVGRFQARAFENLWKNRDRLNAYTRALLALSAHQFGYVDQAGILVDNLENGVKLDSRPDASIIESRAPGSPQGVMATAHWGEDGLYWRWSDGGVEATAFALRALVTIDPTNKLIQPVMNWLVKNRRGAQWSNTRDTAISVLALADYLRESRELGSAIEYDLLVNGQLIATKKVAADDALSSPSRFEIDRSLIRDGANEIRIRRKEGSSPIYFAAEARFFSLEEPVTPAANEIFARRDYYKLVTRPTLLKGHVYDRVPLGDGENVTSGERVEVVMTVEAKNNYEYLIFEDLKPAGLEAVQLQSGGPVYARELKTAALDRKFGSTAPGSSPLGGSREGARGVALKPVEQSDYTGRSRWVYQELRDRKVALFIDKLPEGVWEIRYELRAEVPGRFHALPVVGHAMYAPEVRCNGSEVRINVMDVK